MRKPALLFVGLPALTALAESAAAQQANVAELQRQVTSYASQLGMTPFLVTSVLLFSIGIGCLGLWLNARNFLAFRSVGIYLLSVSGVFLVDYLGRRDWDAFFTTLSSLTLMEMTSDALHISKRWWVWPVRAVCGFYLAGNWLPGMVGFHRVPVDISSALVGILLVVFARRRQSSNGLIAAAIAVVWFFRLPLDPDLGLGRFIPFSFRVAGWTWFYGPLAMVLFGGTALTVFVRELLEDQREKQRLAAELDAGRQVQQRLVPVSLPTVAGYWLEAAYLPAMDVGGDFYQLIAQNNGGTLVVVGDVSGKGLKAAMTGMLAIGALRTLAAEGCSPALLLGRLNREMAGSQDGGFITCICVRIARDGGVVIANAGHLAPYRNGEEVDVDSGLPLGIVADVAYGETALKLTAGDRLTLMSDGVVEAQKPDGELFGFERTRAISEQSAEKVARAALAFGQQDDITVVTLKFAGHQPGESAG